MAAEADLAEAAEADADNEKRKAFADHFTCKLVYLSTRLLVYSFTRLLVYSFTRPLVYSFTRLLYI